MCHCAVPLLISSVGKTDATALAAEQRGFYLRTRASSYRATPSRAWTSPPCSSSVSPSSPSASCSSSPPTATTQRKRLRLAPNEAEAATVSPDKTYQNKPVPFWQVGLEAVGGAAADDGFAHQDVHGVEGPLGHLSVLLQHRGSVRARMTRSQPLRANSHITRSNLSISGSRPAFTSS